MCGCGCGLAVALAEAQMRDGRVDVARQLAERETDRQPAASLRGGRGWEALKRTLRGALRADARGLAPDAPAAVIAA